MTTPSCLIDLKNALPKSAWPRVIPALRHDSLVWSALQNPDFRGLAISKSSGQPQKWTPIHLALLALKSDLQPEALRRTSIAKLDPELSLQSQQAYERHISAETFEIDLGTAGLLALAFKEQHEKNAWEQIPTVGHWRTALACLLNLVKQPVSLLLRLPPQAVIDTLLANPLTLSEQRSLLMAVLTAKPTYQRLATLRRLAMHHPELSSEIGAQIWQRPDYGVPDHGISPAALPSLTPNFESTQEAITEMRAALTLSETQLISGYSQPAALSLRTAWQLAQQLQADLAIQSALVSASRAEVGQAKTDWYTAQTPRKLSTESTAALALSFLEIGELAKAQPLLATLEGEEQASAQLALAWAAEQQGDLKTAQQYAFQLSQKNEQLPIGQVLQLGKLLLNLKQALEAVQLLEAHYQTHPNHLELVRLLAQAQAANGAYPQAIQAIHLATALDPDQLDLQREFAQIHAYAGQWPAAFAARQAIVDTQKNPQAADLHHLARYALRLQRFKEAEAACQAALKTNPNDAVALALLGETIAHTENPQKAQKYLQKAIQLAPDQPQPWLALAHTQCQSGALTTGSETLRKAVHAAPEQAELHLALGQDYARAGALSQALTSLQRARQLAETYPAIEGFYLQGQIALPLAQTLFALGHAEEALATIQGTALLPENQSVLLHLKAQIFLFLGEAQKAIPLLAKALLTNPGNTTVNLDYARAELEANNDPAKAIQALQVLLVRDPQNAQALAWLAAAFKAQGEPAKALKAYKEALGSPLKEDPAWYPKLSIGLAQSAIDLGQPETALAALQQAWQNDPQNLEILKTLAEAYAAANLQEKAHQSAQTARELAPLSLENLTWFAEIMEQLEIFDETINALNCAIELAPLRSDLRLKIGVAYQRIGDPETAFQAFYLIKELEQASAADLRAAAQHLKNLHHPEEALDCLKMAVRRCQEQSEAEVCAEMLRELLNTYTQLERPAEALAVLDEFIQNHPDDAVLTGQRILFLHRLARSDEALAELMAGLGKIPTSQSLHQVAAQIHYEMGHLPKALEHSQKALEQPIGETYAPAVLAQAADITSACLQSTTAREILSCPMAHSTPSNKALPDMLAYLCLRAELALENDEEIEAATALTDALKLAPQQARVLALQARLTARHGNSVYARQIIEGALAVWDQMPKGERETPSGLLALAEANLELHQWSTAIYLLQEAAEHYSQEPRAHLYLARGLVQRAEYQRLYETLRVTRHAPGPSAISDFARQTFEQAILAAAQAYESLASGNSPAQITYWQTRGQAIFNPSNEHARALGNLPHTAESRGALLAALRHSRAQKSSQQTALEHFAAASHRLAESATAPPMLLAQIALALSQHNPRIATNAAQAALDVSIRQNHPSQPIFYALQAQISEQANDPATARQALEAGLALWADEPRWHTWLANILIAAKDADYVKAISHLNRSIELAPKQSESHFTLGQAYLLSGDPKSAVPALEQATRLRPKQPTPWLELARAHQANGEVAQIFHAAERATELDPRNIAPPLLLAETAFEIGNHQKAMAYCQSALQIDPDQPQALLLQARSLDQIGEPSAALQTFNKALEHSPNSIPLMLEQVHLTQKALGGSAAIEALEKIIAEHPDEPRVLAKMAEILVSNDQSGSAIQAAQKALRSNQGELACAQEAQLLEMLGRLMRRNGQLDHAIHYLSEAIQCDPEAIEAYLELGRTYQDRRQYAQALDVFQQAIAIAPGDHRPYYQAGITFKIIKDYAAAEDMLQRATKLAPEDLSIRRQLGGLVALNLVHNRKEDVDIYAE